MNHPARHTLAILLLLLPVLNSSAQEWTRFRGPNGTGLSDAKTIPAIWSDQDFNWKTPMPGPGHSSPVLWGDKIFLTTGDSKGGQVIALCVNAADGQILWQQSFTVTAYHKNDFNSLCSSSPAVDENHVYLCWTTPAKYTLLALTHAGKTAWERDLGPYVSQHGGGTSPIVFHDKVILANEQDGESFLLAVDAATGRTRWQTPRKTTQAMYSTPCVFAPTDAKPALIFTGQSHGVSALDADSGKILWELGDVFDKRTVASPIVAAGLIIGSCGNGGGVNYLVAVKPGGPAQATPAAIAYTIRRSAPYVPTSVTLGDWLFLWSDTGTVTCLRAATGQVQWQERVGGNYFSSPVCVDGRLFNVSSHGEVVVLAASDHYQLLARNRLGETTHSTPAVAGGRMYLHTVKSLISVGGQAVRSQETGAK